MKKDSYIPPELITVLIQSESIICFSDLLDSPDKEEGFIFDDDTPIDPSLL